jgi:hypothetical protein
MRWVPNITGSSKGFIDIKQKSDYLVFENDCLRFVIVETNFNVQNQ